ncbi:MAG: DUF5110 domain-containing protein [Spirochaetales bacterium]|nr:DUF5110 domain-containing protein [Spirochaetales bacterium]
MEGALRDWLELKLATNLTQPLLNLRIAPRRWRGIGAVTAPAEGPGGAVCLQCRRGRIEIAGITPQVWRVVVTGRRETPYRSESVICREGEALSTESRRDGTLRITGQSGELTAVVRPAGATVEFQFAGQTLHADATAPGFRRGWAACRKRSPEPELYLGFGEKTGGLLKNGRRLVMWNTDNADMGPGSDPIYQSCPLQVALRQDGSAHALFFDNPHYSVFRVGGIGGHPESRYAAAGGPLVYYVLAGPSLPEVVEQLTLLTGRSPLPPLWALGHHHSRWDPEESASKVLETAREFRRRRLPCDVIHLDIGHMDGYRCFTWDRERFPDPPALIRGLHEQGFRVIVIADPGIKRDLEYCVYRDGLAEGYFCTDRRGRVHHRPVWPGPAAFPDFTVPAVRAWWGRLFRGYLGEGVDGFWIDMNEPSTFTPARTLTRRVRHRGEAALPGLSSRPGGISHLEVHNLYGLLMARATREGLEALAPERRPYLFTRAAFTGVQRWAGSWTGDNRSSWEHLRMSIPMLLNLGLSGQPLVGPDIGGFLGRPTPELMARWLELGALYPFCRNHTSQRSLGQEIWRFGDEVEEIGRRYLELRYRLLPYLYTLAWEAHASGAPILRPLLYEFPGDPGCRSPEVADTQLMLGPHLLAAPVLRAGAPSREVYLPPGGYWEDWWTGERLDGGRRFEAGAPLDRLPLYVRAGAALPLAGPALHDGPAQHAAEASTRPLLWRVYPAPGAEGWADGSLYLDDGLSVRWQEGEFSLLRLRGTAEGTGRRIRIERVAGSLAPPLGKHPGLTVELAGETGAGADVDASRLPWGWTCPE